MGRIKTKLIKRNSIKLLQVNPDTFKKEFEENKKLVSERAEIHSKKLRNIIAGYITRLVKQQEAK